MVYLDYNATSPVSPVILEEALAFFRARPVGNPSSLHRCGRYARRFINDATDIVSSYLGCLHHQIFWTSGGAEANCWVLTSALTKAEKERPHHKRRIIISAIEHDSLFLAAEALKPSGVVVDICPVTPQGQVDLNILAKLLENPCDLVSIMYANNETGVIQPLEDIATLCQKAQTPLHADCVQALGKVPLELSKSGLTYATFSSHKIGAPQGIGFLVALEEGPWLTPLIHGKQQKALRGGTENVLGIAMTGLILQKITKGTLTLPPELKSWHQRFETELLRRIQGTIIHGKDSPRLCNTTYVGFEGGDGDSILMNLDLEGICASSGSACTSGSTDPSFVLLAMGQNPKIARSSVRFSSGYQTIWSDFEKVLEILPSIIERVRQ